jgi:hypothetical protein
MYETGGSWIISYKALLNWGYVPEIASEILANARKDGYANDGTAEVIYYAQAGTFLVTLT